MQKKLCSSIILLIIIAIIMMGCSGVLNSEDDIRKLKKYESDIIKRVYLLGDGNSYTLIQKVVNRGYKSNIGMYITISFSEEQIKDFEIVSHNESENYAIYITEEWFQKRFLGKRVNKELKLVKMAAKSPEEVVAVTGATISSKAIVEGVNRAINNYELIKGGLINEK